MLGSVGGCRKRARIREYLAGSLPCGASKSVAEVLEDQENAGEDE
jgi:hypothetical protein